MKEFGWTFGDRGLLATATSGHGLEFERLELLGDAIADAVLLPWLYSWSTGTVAVLAGARQQLTSDANLDHLSVLTGLHGVLPAPMQESPSHRADLVESVIGAAFIDGGWPAATAVCECIFGAWLTEPSGVADASARIDTAISRNGHDWNWRCQVWVSGASEPHLARGRTDDPILAEIEAITTGVAHVGRGTSSAWVELSDELRSEMCAGASAEHASAIREMRTMLAAFAGVWFVPSSRLDTTLDPWSPDLQADGVITPFESSLGHDLLRPALERLVLRPGPEQRRLAFVGVGIMKSAASVRAFTDHPDHPVGHLHDTVHSELASDRLYRAAFAAGLVDLLFAGERPTDPVALIRAALGATAVDAGPDHAVSLASEWLDEVRIATSDLEHVSVIECRIDGGPGDLREVEIVLVTPDADTSWRLADDEVDHHVLAIEGLSAALDCIGPEHEAIPILIGAPAGVVGAIDGTSNLRRRAEIADAASRLLARVDQRGLRVLWHGPVHGVSPLAPAPPTTQSG